MMIATIYAAFQFPNVEHTETQNPILHSSDVGRPRPRRPSGCARHEPPGILTRNGQAAIDIRIRISAKVVRGGLPFAFGPRADEGRLLAHKLALTFGKRALDCTACARARGFWRTARGWPREVRVRAHTVCSTVYITHRDSMGGISNGGGSGCARRKGGGRGAGGSTADW